MDKSDFIKEIGQLSYNGNDYDRRYGFQEAIQEVTKLAVLLDDGLTVNAYALFKEQMNSMVELYKEVFEANKRLRDLQHENYTLRETVRLQNEEIRALRIDSGEKMVRSCETCIFYETRHHMGFDGVCEVCLETEKSGGGSFTRYKRARRDCTREEGAAEGKDGE